MAPVNDDRDRSRRWLAAILALGLLIRLGWGLSRPTDDASFNALPDQRGYLELARNLLRGAGLRFIDARFGPTVNGQPAGQGVYAIRTPGYPAFVALCGGSVRAVRVVQAILDTSTALAVYLLARRLLSTRRLAPVLAAAFVAFNPFLVYFSGLLLTETLYTAMLAWGMLLLLGSRAAIWMSGIVVLVLAIHVRPPGIALPVVLGAWAVVIRSAGSLQRPGTVFLRATLTAGLALILTVAALLPWAWRNHRVLGRWVWSSSNDGITAYDGFNPGAKGDSDQRFLDDEPHVREMGELERSDYFAARAKEFARDNPGRVVTLAFRKAARTWTPVPLSDEFGRPLYRLVAFAFAVPFDLLVIVGVLAVRTNKSAIVYALLPALYFTAIHALSVGSLRYRIPAEPPLAVLAGVGAARLVNRRPKEERTAPS